MPVKHGKEPSARAFHERDGDCVSIIHILLVILVARDSDLEKIMIHGVISRYIVVLGFGWKAAEPHSWSEI
jgi:hypothetical protein